jgi:hypothetical protein
LEVSATVLKLPAISQKTAFALIVCGGRHWAVRWLVDDEMHVAMMAAAWHSPVKQVSMVAEVNNGTRLDRVGCAVAGPWYGIVRRGGHCCCGWPSFPPVIRARYVPNETPAPVSTAAVGEGCFHRPIAGNLERTESIALAFGHSDAESIRAP